MPHSVRHHYAARKAGPRVPGIQEYEIVDEHHRPDLRGEFAGAKVYYKGGQQFVKLTPRQAQFYLDQGVLQPSVVPADSTE